MKASIRMAKARYEDKTGKTLSVKALAAKVGVTRPTVYRWLSGDFKEFSLDTLEKLCNALDCQPQDIFWMEEVNNGGK